MNRRREIIVELQRLQRVAQGIQQMYVAHFGLHAAACLHNNVEKMQAERDNLHTVLDAMLDNGEAIQQLTDELERTAL